MDKEILDRRFKELEKAADRHTNGHYVEQTLPGVDTSNVSAFIRNRKEINKRIQATIKARQ
ncbi:hypothetical protein TCA2_4486 [Paenibacillus sp. TCA20]|uniref:Uncharacterized protein n=1 Tax=Paenibacillus urinalis TaxID=521520 RepID=A0ABY7XHE6_9BACL|nr:MULTISPECIES: hypothetical protein [Paenibacillus]WDI05179.1 hypothetical protein PUW25_25560 [Paenibacillus urinalis]GAK41994.1 hypothetical protein TCA2_4486 [Paenibacillus sp. TCA20]